jgi:two-component system response regulator
MDGRTFLSEMRADDNLKAIPVVVLTTSQSDEDILKSYRLGANCFYVGSSVKPFFLRG